MYFYCIVLIVGWGILLFSFFALIKHPALFPKTSLLLLSGKIEPQPGHSNSTLMPYAPEMLVPVVTFSFHSCLHDKLTESTWHNGLSRVCLGCELQLCSKSARSWRPMRQLETTLKERAGFSATDHIHCFPLFFLQDLATAAVDLALANAVRALVLFLLTICPATSVQSEPQFEIISFLYNCM